MNCGLDELAVSWIENWTTVNPEETPVGEQCVGQ